MESISTSSVSDAFFVERLPLSETVSTVLLLSESISSASLTLESFET